MTRGKPSPQTAAQAQECIAAIESTYRTATKRREKVAGFLQLDAMGFTNWTPEARQVWECYE